MQIELIKQIADVVGQLEKVKGFMSISNHEVHVNMNAIKEMDNLQIAKRNCGTYPYEIFTVVDGIKIFAIGTDKDLADFPQFQEYRKAELKKQLAELESQIHYLEEDVDLSGGEEYAS